MLSGRDFDIHYFHSFVDSDEKNMNVLGNLLDLKNEAPFYLLRETPGSSITL